MNHYYFIPIKPINDCVITLNNIIASHGYEILDKRRTISRTIGNSTFCDYTSGIVSNIGSDTHGAMFMHYGEWSNLNSCADLLGIMTYTFMDDSTIKIKYLCRNVIHSRTSHSIHNTLSVGKRILQYFLRCVTELSHTLNKTFIVYLNATEPLFYRTCGMKVIEPTYAHYNKIKELETSNTDGFNETDLNNYFVWDTETGTSGAKGYKKRKKTQKYIKCKTCRKRRKTKSKAYI
jgi:hypothetical protein